jgi:hypothetical protein
VTVASDTVLFFSLWMGCLLGSVHDAHGYIWFARTQDCRWYGTVTRHRQRCCLHCGGQILADLLASVHQFVHDTLPHIRSGFALVGL